ncbi:MAG: hypothetical protein RL685_7602 [Pseudomonadota bacterium]
MVRSGKARYVGFSNLSAWQAMKAIGYAEANGLARFQSDALRSVSGELDVSVASVALAWQLTRSFVTSVIIGAKNREQLLDNLRSTEVRLSTEQVKRLDEASVLPSEYPGWMIETQNRDPRGVAHDGPLR